MNTSTHVDADKATARYHCKQQGDEHTVAIADGDLSWVYLNGTRDELMALVVSLTDAVDAIPDERPLVMAPAGPCPTDDDDPAEWDAYNEGAF